ncbi:MAG: hypothetical protein HY746_07605, partial [Elusimicrobia bacterium]|nr:hypothetical protein [Elusimicrobiota bacterium]
ESRAREAMLRRVQEFQAMKRSIVAAEATEAGFDYSYSITYLTLEINIPLPFIKGSADAIKNQAIEFPIVEYGRGASSSFTQSSCLFCAQHRNEAEETAKARASYYATEKCESRGGFIKEEPETEVVNCEKINGWKSYYVCVAKAKVTCQMFK